MGWSFWPSTMPKGRAWPNSVSIWPVLPSWSEGFLESGRGGQNVLQVSAKATQLLQPLWGSLNEFLFSLKDRAAFLFGEDSDGFSHAPAGSAEHLQALD